jgi:hypothetical protein
MPLTRQQEDFCRFYVTGKLSATDAYAQAYPKCKRSECHGNASRMTAKDSVKQRIAELTAKASADTGLTPAFVLAQLREAIEYRGKGWSPSAWVAALALAFKHLGLLKEDAPHPERKTPRVSALTDEQKRALLTTILILRAAPQ